MSTGRLTVKGLCATGTCARNQARKKMAFMQMENDKDTIYGENELSPVKTLAVKESLCERIGHHFGDVHDLYLTPLLPGDGTGPLPEVILARGAAGHDDLRSHLQGIADP